jgi:hypothetical protein
VENRLLKKTEEHSTMEQLWQTNLCLIHYQEGQNENFFGSISRSKLIAFEDLTKTTKLKCRSGGVVEAHICSFNKGTCDVSGL